ncbi:MAG: hypothetical protein NTW94_00560 [Legionellales bacterium]|nr:hypothetical protein [Legionellales bacterium]
MRCLITTVWMEFTGRSGLYHSGKWLKSSGIDINFQVAMVGETETAITKDYVDGSMGFDDASPASPLEYIDALIGFCARDVFDTIIESPFYRLKTKEDLSISTQFFLAEINIYCKSHDISADNFGNILDGSAELSTLVTTTVMNALRNRTSIEQALCALINSNASHFHLHKPLSPEDIKQIEKDFMEHYTTIQDSPHFDEFTILDTTKSGNFGTHQSSICTDLSKLIGIGYPELDNAFFNEVRSDFSRMSVVIPHNNAFVQQNVEPNQAERIAAINSGLPLGFVVARLSSEEQVALISSLSENITSIVQSPAQLTHVLSFLSPEAKLAVVGAFMSKLSEIIQSDQGLSLPDLSNLLKDIDPEQDKLIQKVTLFIVALSEHYPASEVRALTAALIGEDHEHLKAKLEHFMEVCGVSRPELITALSIEPSWTDKINAAMGLNMVGSPIAPHTHIEDARDEPLVEPRIEHVNRFKAVLREIEKSSTEATGKRRTGPLK